MAGRKQAAEASSSQMAQTSSKREEGASHLIANEDKTSEAQQTNYNWPYLYIGPVQLSLILQTNLQGDPKLLVSVEASDPKKSYVLY